MNFSQIISTCRDNSVNFIVFGSHALHMLRKNFSAEPKINLAEKDLDILVKNDENFSRLKNILPITRTRKSTNFVMYQLRADGLKTDFVVRMRFRSMLINGNFIPEISYQHILPHSLWGRLYDHDVRYVNLHVYYGIIKSTGLKKHHQIAQKIETQYPNIIDVVKV